MPAEACLAAPLPSLTPRFGLTKSNTSRPSVVNIYGCIEEECGSRSEAPEEDIMIEDRLRQFAGRG